MKKSKTESQKLKTDYFFEDIPVIGKLPPVKLAMKLTELGDVKAAEAIEVETVGKKGFGLPSKWPWGSNEVPAYAHTGHAFGYIPPTEPGSGDYVAITHAGNIKADLSLMNKRVNITLGALRAADYPGEGMHRVLFDFYAQNRLPNNQNEDLHFNQVYRVQEGESAGIIGYPIFTGLNVGTLGATFKCYTVNVQNDQDQAILDFLDSDVFKAGLTLATTAQPAIAPLAGITVGVTKMIASRHMNVPVQDFFMGLDFTNLAYGARLAEGTYVAVQIPEASTGDWDWTKWTYDKRNGKIVKKDDSKKTIPYNFIVFNVSKFEE
jgi:hypothetical protein